MIKYISVGIPLAYFVKFYKRWGVFVYRKLIGALYMINILLQGLMTLVIPAGLMFLLSWLLVSYASAPTWIYAALIPIGAVAGFISMIKFVIRAAEGAERLNVERNDKK